MSEIQKEIRGVTDTDSLFTPHEPHHRQGSKYYGQHIGPRGPKGRGGGGVKITENGLEHVKGDPNCSACCKLSGGSRWPQRHRNAKIGHPVDCEGYMHCEKAFAGGNYVGVKRKCDKCSKED